MVDGQCHIRKPLMDELADDYLENWIITDRHQRLGENDRVRLQPRSLSAGQDHHPHGLKDVSPVVKFFTDALEPKK